MKHNDFPINVFPQRLQAFITAYLTATNLPGKFVCVSVFMALATAIGSTYKLFYKVGYEVFASFYCVLVASSGSGKTAPLSMAYRPIETRRRNEYLAYRKALREYSNYLKLTDEERAGHPKVEPPIYTPFIVDDFTIEKLWRIMADCPRGITIKNEEIAAMFKAAGRYSGGKSADSEFFNSFWSGEAKSVDRVSGEPLYISPAALSIFGTIQPGAAFDNMFRNGNDQNGLIPRFLFSCLPNAGIIPQTKDDLDLSIFGDYTRIINRLLDVEMMVDLDGNLVPRPLRLSPEARDLYLSWYNNVFTPLATEESRSLYYEGLIKLAQYVLKFVIVLQVARYATDEGTDEVVELDAMKGAILMFNYFRAELDYVNGVVNEKDPTLKMSEQQRSVYNHFGGGEFIVGTTLYETLYEKYGFSKDQMKKFVQNKQYFTRVRHATYRRTYMPEFLD